MSAALAAEITMKGLHEYYMDIDTDTNTNQNCTSESNTNKNRNNTNENNTNTHSQIASTTLTTSVEFFGLDEKKTPQETPGYFEITGRFLRFF